MWKWGPCQCGNGVRLDHVEMGSVETGSLWKRGQTRLFRIVETGCGNGVRLDYFGWGGKWGLGREMGSDSETGGKWGQTRLFCVLFDHLIESDPIPVPALPTFSTRKANAVALNDGFPLGPDKGSIVLIPVPRRKPIAANAALPYPGTATTAPLAATLVTRATPSVSAATKVDMAAET